jgi:phosphatidylinositol-3-phosphatase
MTSSASSSRQGTVCRKGRRGWLITAVAVLSLALALASCALRHNRAEAAAQPPLAHIDRFFVIMLENRSPQDLIDDPAAPALTQLAHRYAYASAYYGVTHPSQPNYAALMTGWPQWSYAGSRHARDNPRTLVSSLDRAHVPWSAYMEAMPSTGFTGKYWPSSRAPLYAAKHNPFMLIKSIRDNPTNLRHIKPFTQLSADLNGPHPPRFTFIAPDLCHDMHGNVDVPVAGHPETPCPVSHSLTDGSLDGVEHEGDAFVQSVVRTIMQSRAWTRHSVIVITADESDRSDQASTGGWSSTSGCCDSPWFDAGSARIGLSWPGGVYGGGLVPAIVIDPTGPHHFVDHSVYNHYSLLRTIEDAFSLPEIGHTHDTDEILTLARLINPPAD